MTQTPLADRIAALEAARYQAMIAWQSTPVPAGAH